jgi:hypothetical protein
VNVELAIPSIPELVAAAEQGALAAWEVTEVMAVQAPTEVAGALLTLPSLAIGKAATVLSLSKATWDREAIQGGLQPAEPAARAVLVERAPPTSYVFHLVDRQVQQELPVLQETMA